MAEDWDPDWQKKELIAEFIQDLKEIATTIKNHELARMKVEKWIDRLPGGTGI